MSRVEELIAGNVELATLPDVYFRVRTVMEDPSAGLDALAGVIAYDPALSARFLRMANSPVFALVSRVETVSRAVTILGMQQTHDIVLATSVVRVLGGVSSNIVDMEVFWRCSVHCAIAARMLAERCDVLDSERLFVEGLLRDLGHVLMYLKVPGTSRQVFMKARGSGMPLYMAERELFGFDFAEVGAALLARWGLPRSLQLAVRHHTEPQAAQEFVLETAILHIAAALTDRSGEGEESPAASPVDPVVWGITGLSPDDVDVVGREASGQLGEVLNAFFPQVQSQPTRQKAVG